MKNLEKFIDMHRNEFDVYQPGSQVWVGISSGLPVSASLVSKIAKLLAPGAKKLALVFTLGSAMLAAGVWFYRSHQSREKISAPATQSTGLNEINENAGLKDKTPLSQNTTQAPPVLANEVPDAYKEAGEPASWRESSQLSSNNTSSIAPVEEQADSFYRGVKTLTLGSFGYNFKIKRSSLKTTQVRILQPAFVKNRVTRSDMVLKIEQKGAELVFEYENQEKEPGSWTNYQLVSTGEIEILIPDGEISKVTATSSNIELKGYTTEALLIQTVSGNITVAEINAKLSLNSSSGNMIITGLTGELQCDNVSGKISVTNLHGNATSKTNSGESKFFNSRGTITCRSTSGSLRLEDIQGNLDIYSNSGNIAGKNIRLMDSCNIQSKSGNIDLGLQNNSNNLSFDLNSVSGKMKIEKENINMEEQRSLRAGTGKIVVKAQTVSGNQIYR